jgi:DNA-binding transcriptional LysR family regulator
VRYRRLGYFVAVAEELSFTRAAARLHMAQPPLSHQISLLERELGTALFDRSRRAIRLTPAGAALLPEARRLLADLDETARMVRRVGEGAVGRLSIAFVPSAINGRLSDVLRVFRIRHADVELVLREMPPDPLLRAVQAGRFDLGVLYRPIAGGDLAERVLSRERLLLALPDGHPAAYAAEVDLADVRDEPFVLPEQHDVPGLHAAITATFADAGIAPRAAQRGVWLVQTVLGLVAAGAGLAVVPSSAQALQRRGVTLRPIHGARHTVDLTAVWRPDPIPGPLEGLLDVLGRAEPDEYHREPERPEGP